MPLTPGSNFGPYRIIEPLGRGGMASVHKAYESGLDRFLLALRALHDTRRHVIRTWMIWKRQIVQTWPQRAKGGAALAADLGARHLVGEKRR